VREPARAEVFKQPFDTGLLAKWGGAVPFLGAITAIGLTKEILLIDPELLLAAHIGFTFVGVYLIIGDSFKNAMKGAQNRVFEVFYDMHDAAVAGVGHYKVEQRAKLDAGGCWEEYLQEYKGVMTLHAEAMALKPQHAAREKVLAALEAIRARERMAEAGKMKKFLAAYEVAVKTRLQDPKVQTALFTSSLRMLNDESDEAEKALDTILDKVLEDAVEATDIEVFPESLLDLEYEADDNQQGKP
jgi:hypothetical protein